MSQVFLQNFFYTESELFLFPTPCQILLQIEFQKDIKKISGCFYTNLKQMLNKQSKNSPLEKIHRKFKKYVVGKGGEVKRAADLKHPLSQENT